MSTLDPKIRFLWLDVETTGLDPSDDLLLEVAAWPTRSADPFDLDPEDAVSWVVGYSGGDLGAHLSPFTWEMHTKNGLAVEVVNSHATAKWVEEGLIAACGGDRVRALSSDYRLEHQWHLAGNSVHFDRGFLRVNLRGFERLLFHRHLDVSSLLIAARAQGFEIPKAEPAHRAMDDVKQSIMLAAKCFELGGTCKYDAYWHEALVQKLARVTR